MHEVGIKTAWPPPLSSGGIIRVIDRHSGKGYVVDGTTTSLTHRYFYVSNVSYISTVFQFPLS